MNRKAIETAVMASFTGEVEAYKPGNVSIHADGHDMTVKDFLLSAEVSTPLLCHPNKTVGQRILESVKETQKKVGCNTNLGMLLLFAPIIKAAEQEFETINDLQHNLEITLSSLTQSDARLVFEAISLAKPGGLGNVETQDVNESPECSLIEAMALASKRDSIALQYSNNFMEVFEGGFSTIKHFDKSWNSVKWATVSCYLMFMSSMNDSHIERKYGNQIAETIKKESGVIAEQFQRAKEPELSINLIKRFDEELKAKNYNPGTSADLTAASLLVYTLTE